MRLLRTNPDGSFSLTWFVGDRIPRYAILSHRWEEDNHEVTLEDLSNGVASSKKGYKKIQFCAEQAKKDGLEFFWVDSCCIDKTSSAELSEAINSMFRWYRKAAKCYVYLSDVTAANCSQTQWQSAFRQSTWFTRGWTLQELLAPRSVEFFSHDNERLGDKVSLEQQIHEATGITVRALQGMPLVQFSLDERLQWMVNRKTTIEEDFAYCLLGVLNIHIPLLYGEGAENACFRLFEEINKRSDVYLFRQGRSAFYIIKEATWLIQEIDWYGVKTDPTPLLLAARLGMATLAKLLLDGEARVDLEDPRSGRTPLSWAAGSGHEAVVKLLLEAEADINLKDKEDQTPLLLAVGNRHEAVIKLLLEAEADINLKDKEGQTPLLLAVRNRHEAVVKLLLATGRVDVNLEDLLGQTPLLLAVRNRHEAVVKLLLATCRVNVDLEKPLLSAARNGHEAVVKLLLATGRVDVDSNDRYGQTPLSLAAKGGHEAVVKLLKSFSSR